MAPLLHTKRLRLRAVTRADQQKVFEGLSHPEVIAYYGVSYTTYEDTAAQMDWYEQGHENNTGYFWVMEHALTHDFIGVVGLYNIQATHHNGELGYWILPAFWNQGYTTEALAAVIHFTQTELKLHRIYAEIELENTASLHLMKRLGFDHEGTKTDCEYKNGRYISLSLWAKIFPEN